MTNFINEAKWGWSLFFEEPFFIVSAGFQQPLPLKVMSESSGVLRLFSPRLNQEFFGKISGKVRWSTEGRENLPAVGDWVYCDLGVSEGNTLRIEGVLPRKSALIRKAPEDRGGNQAFAANLDEVWIITSLNHDYSEERVDRILSLVMEGGTQARVILSKIDLVPEAEWAVHLAQVADRFPNTPVHLLSSLDSESIESLRGILKPAMTIALVGSSGVGKSTLINSLLGSEELKTQEVREEDSKGRHTTTRRELIEIPGGSFLIDTPGVREWRLTAGAEISRAFEDIEALAQQCRFSNCSHGAENSCAIRQALDDGRLEQSRWTNFQKLQREREFEERKGNKQLQSEQKKVWKKIHKQVRSKNRERY